MIEAPPIQVVGAPDGWGPGKPGDAGIDLPYQGQSAAFVFINCPAQIPTGIRVKIPEGWVGFIRPRSSTFTRHGLFVMEGVIDSGYTGELFVLVWNPGIMGQHAVTIEPGVRLAQLIVVPHHSNEVVRVYDLPQTRRGQTGFGSTDGGSQLPVTDKLLGESLRRGG